MSVRFLIYLGILACVALFLYAAYRVLAWLAIASLFMLGEQAPPPVGWNPSSASTPRVVQGPPAPVPETVVPSGYRGIAVICSKHTSEAATSPTLTLPESGTAVVTAQVPPTRWVFTDGKDLSFKVPPSVDAEAVYATYADRAVPGLGTVWIVCIGTPAQHAAYEPQEAKVLEQFIAKGCPTDFEPPHESSSPFQPRTGTSSGGGPP